MGSIFNILFLFEIISCLTGLLLYKKIKQSIWKIFPLYLVFIVLAELTGNYLRQHFPLQVNIHFYSYFEIPVEFIFFFTLFALESRKGKSNILPVACTAIYIICWLVDIFYIKKYKFMYSFSYMVGSLLLLILVLRFFISLVTSDEIITFKKNMLFWVSLGLLLFYLGSFPYYGLINTMAPTHHDLINIFKNISYVFNCMMYLLFTCSFIWGRPNT